VAVVLQENPNHTHVSLVHGHVKRSLPSLVPRVQVCRVPRQKVDDLRFVAETCVVDRSVSVLVLFFNVGSISEETLDNLNVSILKMKTSDTHTTVKNRFTQKVTTFKFKI
jgi:hypothetical protein